MPRHEVDRSLYEPLEVVLGDKVFRTVPLTNKVVKAIEALDKRKASKEVDAVDSLLEMAAVMFGVTVAEVEEIDIRALTDAVQYVNEEMAPKPKATAQAVPPAPVAPTSPAGGEGASATAPVEFVPVDGDAEKNG